MVMRFVAVNGMSRIPRSMLVEVEETLPEV